MTDSPPASFYGHNEFDLRNLWRGGEGRGLCEIYHRSVPISEPRGDFGGRMGLYELLEVVRGGCGVRRDGEGGRMAREEVPRGMRGLVGWYGSGEWGGGGRWEK